MADAILGRLGGLDCLGYFTDKEKMCALSPKNMKQGQRVSMPPECRRTLRTAGRRGKSFLRVCLFLSPPAQRHIPAFQRSGQC